MNNSLLHVALHVFTYSLFPPRAASLQVNLVRRILLKFRLLYINKPKCFYRFSCSFCIRSRPKPNI